ncbi:hypothetical protein [Methylocystis echinoides]|uniref:Uncharacterized protein n=1 Tax=Methylocystis echinoides TaxID=29468 RepID=A0A9W6GYK7_9HYPH|nr:hypothetical protein [Methylocystis echinoides]GLI95354.1 hypothetical protein LMG27198_43460 [Methylocystis echinoides]
MGCVGIALALWLISQRSFHPGIDLTVVRHWLAYVPVFDRPPLVVDALYLLLTVVPLVASCRRGVALFVLCLQPSSMHRHEQVGLAFRLVPCCCSVQLRPVPAIQERPNVDLDEASAELSLVNAI